MSTRVGDALPDDVLRALSGRDLAAVADRVVVVSTVDERGCPHPALLSYFEVVAIDPRTIRLATYAESRTTANAQRGGKLTLVLVEPAYVYYIKGAARVLAPSMRVSAHTAKLDLHVEEVLRDEPDRSREPDARIATGIRYVNPHRAAELARAQRVIAELRA